MLPAAYTAHIHMHKIGLGVVTDSSAMQLQGCISQARGFDTRNADIDCHRLHMQTVQGHTMTMSAEKFVAPRRAIAANDINFSIGPSNGSGQVVKEVEHSRIVVVNVTGAMIAKIFIESGQSFRNIKVTLPIDNVESFAGVRVEKVQAIFGPG